MSVTAGSHLLSSLVAPLTIVAIAVLAAPITGPRADLPAGPRSTPGPAVPVRYDGFGPGSDVELRLACGPQLGSVRADSRGGVTLPAGLLLHLPAGGHRLLVTGPGPAAPNPGAGAVVVTVPTTYVIGLQADGTGRTRVDPEVPVPRC